jgi:hypothetical protein
VFKGLEGFEPSAYGLGILVHPLILNKINNLPRTIPHKFGEFRNPDATKVQTNRQPKRRPLILRKTEARHHDGSTPAFSTNSAGVSRGTTAEFP